MKNTLLALLSFILLSTPLAATAQQFGDFTYTSDGSVITITGYTGPGGAVTIPDTITGLPVTGIGNSAFQYKTILTSVTIPGSVTTIGVLAFYNCPSLTNVTMLNGVTTIGNGAFVSCTSLNVVTIPGSVTSLGDDAFGQCSSLTNFTIPASVVSIGVYPFIGCRNLVAIAVDTANASYSDADGVLFNKSQTKLIQYPGGKAGSYSIPGSVTSIGGDAFSDCANLTSITIPGSVTSILPETFDDCAGLTSVTFLGSVTNIDIGYYAFYGCTSLTNVTIRGNVTGIGDNAFASCINLTRVFFNGNAPGVWSTAFDGDGNATIYYLPGTTGWFPTFAGRPTRLWNPLVQTSGPSFGVGPAGFGFNITGTADIPIVVEACTNLVNASWVPLQSLNLTNGAFYFSDPNWANYPARNYRIRSP